MPSGIIRLLGFLLLLNVYSVQAKTIINIKSYGADNTGKKEVSKVFQTAIKQLHKIGGGTIKVPQGVYLFKYPVFLPSNIQIIGVGKKTIILSNISISEGRCAFLVGNSYEVNEQTIEEWRKDNVRGWPVNSSFKDIPIPDGMEIKASDARVITRNSSIRNLLIKFDYSNCKSNWGGYGIQFSNAANCYAKDIWTINACQAIGIGSDTSPATPGCVNVYCYNIHVIKPDPVHTYYSIGFIANSNNCGIIGADSFKACTNGSEDGSLLSLNFTTNCTLRDIKGVVGRSKTSEGILLNNSYNAQVSNIFIENASKGIVTYYTHPNLLSKYSTTNNLIENIRIKDSDYGIVLLSKYSKISNITLTNCKKTIDYNINASHNTISGLSKSLLGMSKKDIQWLKENNNFVN